MNLKTSQSQLFANSKKRAYTKIYKAGKISKEKKVHKHLLHLVSGNTKLVPAYKILLVSKDDKVVVDKLCETSRVLLMRNIGKIINKLDYNIEFLKYPHFYIRQHTMLTGAGADRLSQGMRNAFGKPVTRSMRIKANEAFLQINLSKTSKIHFVKVKKILSAAQPWFPFRSYIKIDDLSI